MSGRNDKKMGAFLREVCNWSWAEFTKAEHDDKFTSNQAIIFGLIRACTMQKMPAIVMSLNRLDGKLKTPVEIEYPKVFWIYPNAKSVEGSDTVHKPAFAKVTDDPTTVNEVERIAIADSSMEILPRPEPEPEIAPEEDDLPSMSLRETVDKMSDFPREVPNAIVDRAIEVEQAVRAEGDCHDDDIPRVKSVVAAHLLTMAANRHLGAINEVFDQIDGKLVETIQIIGQDLHIPNFASVAPAGAVLNADGVYQIQATVVQNMWAERLGKVLT